VQERIETASDRLLAASRAALAARGHAVPEVSTDARETDSRVA
jgi:hypothetical protein